MLSRLHSWTISICSFYLLYNDDFNHYFNGFRHIRSINRAVLNDDKDILLFLFKQMKHVFGK